MSGKVLFLDTFASLRDHPSWLWLHGDMALVAYTVSPSAYKSRLQMLCLPHDVFFQEILKFASLNYRNFRTI